MTLPFATTRGADAVASGSAEHRGLAPKEF